jgi:hypothetical protein
MTSRLRIRAVQLVLAFLAIWTATMLFLYWRAHG